MKILFSFIFVSLFVLNPINAFAQNVEVKLKTADSTSSFQVVDSSRNTLFGLDGSGTVSIGNLPWNARYIFQVGSNDWYNSFGRSINLSAESAYNSGGSLNLSAGSSGLIFENQGGQIHMSGGGTDSYKGGNVEIKSGTGEYYGGDIFLKTAYGVTKTGDINLETGSAGGGEGGNINLTCSLQDANSPGSINLSAGRGALNGGNIVLIPGPGFNSDGILELNGSGTYTGTWTQVSDRRFKKKINPIKNAAEKINKLNGIEYSWLREKYPERHFPDGKKIGLIAQEVENVFPSLVETDVEGYKSIDYTKLSVILIEAVKEQQKEIDELKDLVKKLSEKLN